MKAFERQTEGYSQECLEIFMRGTLFPSSFFDQPVPVRGVCFAAGLDSTRLAREFAEDRLGLGTVSFRLSAMTPEAWHEFSLSFTHPKAEVSKVAFLLPNLDLASEKLQEKIAEAILATSGSLWFASVSDHRKLIPGLRLALLVYLGLGANSRMRFLAQSGQQLTIDEGSLQQPPPGQ